MSPRKMSYVLVFFLAFTSLLVAASQKDYQVSIYGRIIWWAEQSSEQKVYVSNSPLMVADANERNYEVLRKRFPSVSTEVIEAWKKVAGSAHSLDRTSPAFLMQLDRESKEMDWTDQGSLSWLNVLPKQAEESLNAFGGVKEVPLPAEFQSRYPKIDSIIRLSPVARVGSQALILYSRSHRTIHEKGFVLYRVTANGRWIEAL